MSRLARRRPSPALVISILALVIAASGTAVAASRLVNGDSLIKKATLSGNRLRTRTVTGRQIKVSTLSKVPSARRADYANSAGTAVTANSAGNALNAGALSGHPASAFMPASARIGTPGIVKEGSSSTGNGVILFTSGPFTVTMTCTSSGTGGANTALTITATSSEAGSVLDGTLVQPANGAVTIPAVSLGIPGVPTGKPSSPTSQAAFENDVNMDFEAPSGSQAVVLGADGVNSLGTACWANFSGLA